VREVMRHPGGQELPQRHQPELGMLTLERQVIIRQRPLFERGNVFGAAPSEFVQQLGERRLKSPLGRCRLRRHRWPGPMADASHHNVGTPCVRALGGIGPRRRQAGQERSERARRAFQHRHALGEVKVHLVVRY
jgi:hypothetical protein